MSESRILAVKIDSKLFDKLDEFVEEKKITKQKYTILSMIHTTVIASLR